MVAFEAAGLIATIKTFPTELDALRYFARVKPVTRPANKKDQNNSYCVVTEGNRLGVYPTRRRFVIIDLVNYGIYELSMLPQG